MNAVEATFRVVVDISWRSSCLVLVVMALRSLLRGRLPARVLFWVWIAVALRLLVPFTVATAWSPFNFAHFTLRSSPGMVSGVETVATQRSIAEPPSPNGSATDFLSGERLSRRAPLTPGQWVALGWGAGVGALLLVRIHACVRFVRKLRRSPAEPSPAIAALLAETTSSLGFRRVEIIVTDVVHAPALHGIFRPTLLFPPRFLEQLTPREIQLTIAHELGHDQRRDLLAQVLIHAAAIVHWFNPLIWVVARVARNDCELACDEFVMRRFDPTDRELYGATLLRIVTLARGGTPAPFALGVVESKKQIRRRIQMIAANDSSTFARTLLGCALFSFITVLSLTSEIRAQQPAVVGGSGLTTTPRATPGTVASNITYDPSNDSLNALFPNGTVATIGDKVITVDDVRRELAPLIAQLQREARNQDDFNQGLNRLQNSAIKDLIGRVLLIKEFHFHKDGEGGKHIPAEYVDNAIADRLREQFDGDRAKFLDYLQSRGTTMSDYRKEVEEEIIYHYMKSQEAKSDGNIKGKQAQSGPKEGQVHLRMIQLNRVDGETDAALLDKANAILVRFKNGENFENLAREFDQDGRRDKGGDWGWHSPADLKPEYAEQLFALKKGEVSAPILAKEGCFLLYAEDRK